MKFNFFSVLAFALAVLFSPVVFAVEKGHAVDMPGFNPLTGVFFVAESTANCRDVSVSIQKAVLYTKQIVSQRPLHAETETRIWAGNQTLIPNGDGFTIREADQRTGIGLVFALAKCQYGTYLDEKKLLAGSLIII